MEDKLYFSRDAKLYIQLTSKAGAYQGFWEVPVLDGFSFSQATNQTEIGVSEIESTGTISRRGRRLFTDSLAPAEWSFRTYIRPTIKNTSEHHLVDEVLWAAMTGGDLHAETASSENGDFIRNASDRAVTGGLVLDVAEATSLKRSGDGGLLSFAELNRISLPEITLYFVFETAQLKPMVYRLSKAAVNECSIEFDIDGIAIANWSGFAKEVEDLQSKGEVVVSALEPVTSYDAWLESDQDNRLHVLNAGAWKAAVYNTGISSTSNFFRHRVTQLEVKGRNTDILKGNTYTISSISGTTIATGTDLHGLKVGDTVTISGVAVLRVN
ncbi:MAG: hypothetical protein HOE45_01625 [Gammaproteobacteria bacterium]|jgi:hypothetical protein|nr:hypothetical protein [Gammaproteobacteria bacterium]MBT4145580.1 hypothetical protein [Gammaproteobacteria bacterium]MBT5222951.1 hypothetical protein [Gammaproteobacteria bacterium]MBT6576253.1 hypothetical protein [Gammaproteobacteria bacterium]